MSLPAAHENLENQGTLEHRANPGHQWNRFYQALHLFQDIP